VEKYCSIATGARFHLEQYFRASGVRWAAGGRAVGGMAERAMGGPAAVWSLATDKTRRLRRCRSGALHNF